MKRCRTLSPKKLLSKTSKVSMTTFLKILFFCVSVEFSVVRGSRYRHAHNSVPESKQTVCYEHLGCFSKLPPFAATMPLPMSPEKINTGYYLRTRQNPDRDQPIIPEAGNLTASFFDPQKPTKIIIHGFVMMEAHLADWVPEVTETILYQEDVNVIQINWVQGAAVEYDYAASNTRLVGAQVGHLINMLMEVHNARAEDFHLVGFSLGAHVAGFAGKKVQEGGKRNVVGRITGLDPANPGFNYDDPAVRLDKTDAKFVDVIHTDTSTVLVMASGMNRNLGHIDFYPNGGADQTGCNSWNKESWISSVTDSTVCDHLRAPQLFKASINATGDEPHMTGYKCESFEKFKRGVCLRCGSTNGGSNRCRRMGYWARPLSSKKNQVQYYLVTSGAAPFTVKHYQVQIHWRNSTTAVPEGFKAKLFITLHGDKQDSQQFALNDGSTFHVVAGHTTRFLVTQDTMRDLGSIERVTFRWERPTCWTYFFCPRENINLKRIKIFDAEDQERSVFLPIGRNRDERIRSHSVEPGVDFELLRTSYIRAHYPKRYKTLDREAAAVRKNSENVIVPPIVPVHHKKTLRSRPNQSAGGEGNSFAPLSSLSNSMETEESGNV